MSDLTETFMKKITCLLLAVALMVTQGVAYGQTGLLFSQSDLTPTDLARMSFTGTQFGTARSMGMGGAFTSLGADLTTMSLNPAGLGMYQSSELGFTPMVSITKTNNTDPLGITNGSNGKTRFSPANIGTAINFYQGSGGLTSFTFGVAYNKVADFNMISSMQHGSNSTSVADLFMQQLAGTSHSSMKSATFRNTTIDRWGALMAYNTYLIDPGATDGVYGSNVLSDDAVIYQGTVLNTRGSIGEYNFAAGFNFQNKLYLGFSVGVQDLQFKQTVSYSETYENNSGANDPAVGMFYGQSYKITGTGVNLKVGLTYRPVEELRIGVAVHTPTYMNTTHSYNAGMTVYFPDGNNWDDTPYDRFDYDFSTPTRFLGGISYTFGSTGILAVDYERTWYNSMRLNNDDSDYRWGFNDEVKYLFKGNNTVRAGAEIRPFGPDVALRAGFTYTDSMVDIDLAREAYDSPVPKQNIGASGGIGFRLGRMSYLDLAYLYNHTKYTDYYVYHYVTSDNKVWDSGNPTQKADRHSVVATLGFRF